MGAELLTEDSNELYACCFVSPPVSCTPTVLVWPYKQRNTDTLNVSKSGMENAGGM